MSVLNTSVILCRKRARVVFTNSLFWRETRYEWRPIFPKRFSTDDNPLTISHVRGPTSIPVIPTPFGQLLEEKTEKYSDRIFIKSIEQQVQLNYGEALRKADQMAAGLLNMGLQKGDRVVIWAPNTWQWVVTNLALSRAGLITVALNPSMVGEDAIHSLILTKPAAIVAPAEHNNIKYLDFLLQIAPELRESTPGSAICSKLDHLRAVICAYGNTPKFAVGLDELSSLASESDIAAIKAKQKEFGSDDAALILFTSGTTGKPKAAVIPQKGFVNNGNAVMESLPAEERLKVHSYCVQVPLFHSFGLMGVISYGVQLGAKLIFPSPTYSPKAILKAFVQEKCTVISGTPTMYLDMIRRTEHDGRPLHQADVALVGASPLVPQLGRDIAEVLKMKRIQVMYGLSEGTGVLFQSTQNDTLDHICYTVGKIIRNVEGKVVDSDGKTVPVDTPGELWIRGYLTMKEYFGQPDQTKETLTEDGWIKTGDQFAIDENGYGKIIGRFKDIIIRGGENISPKEVEDILTTHPSIIDAQVVGVKDDRLGEEGCACLIVRQPITGKEIYEFCKDKIAKFKIPRYYTIKEVYPRTGSGKIQKHKLRDTCNKLLDEGKLIEVEQKEKNKEKL